MTHLLFLLSWLISLSPNAYALDGTCYKACQTEYYQCLGLCEDGDMDCFDICYALHDQCLRDCEEETE